jgi:hypothetical protein
MYFNNGRGNFGYLQILILKYALNNSETFCLSDVAVYYRLDSKKCKCLHDAAKRLTRRGILRKIRHGLYKLEKFRLTPMDLNIVLSKVTENELCGCFGGFIVRAHVSSCPSLLKLYWIVEFAYRLLGNIRMALRKKFRDEGVPAGVVLSIARGARGLAGLVGRGLHLVGVHGRFGYGRHKPLISLDVAGERYFKELGVDVIPPEGVQLPKFHLKIYTTENPYRQVGAHMPGRKRSHQEDQLVEFDLFL